MKKFLLASIVILPLFIGCSSSDKQEVTEESLIEMRSNADEFTTGLRNVLVGQIQTNGLIAAVSVCSDTAQVMTNNFSIEKGIYIKRVSFNIRNPNNSPDDFETEGLNYFQKLLNEGKLDPNSEYFKIIRENDVEYLRYMKPIVLQAPCLNCHGPQEQIIPDVQQIINSRYKNDKAINYHVGDLRGAVSIQKVY